MPPVSVTFVGNCQSEALATFYREFCVTDAEAEVAYIDILLLAEDSAERARSLRRLSHTQVLVQQVFDWPRPLNDYLSPGCERFSFPNATFWSLWPHTGVPHARNHEAPTLAGVDVPYQAEYGNAFLNRFIKAGMPAAEGVRRYLELDIVQRANVPSRFEKEMDLLDQRDRLSRIGLRGAIESHFRHEPLFRTRGHPNLRIFSLVAGSLFRGMGVDPSRIDIGLRSLHQTPFTVTELPIHPKIAEYFGLSYAGPEATYQYSFEGRFSFAEYAERYMSFTYNGALRRLRASRDLPPEQRLAIADEALALSPRSAFVLRHRTKLLARLGQHEAALAAAREACAAEPNDPEPWFELAAMLRQRCDLAAADQAAQSALARHPHHAGALKLLGRLALDSNRAEQAVPYLRDATVYAPRDVEARGLYAEALKRLGVAAQ